MSINQGKLEGPSPLTSSSLVDIEGAKNKQTGLKTVERFAYLTVKAMQATEIKSDDSMIASALKIAAKIGIALATLVTLPISLIVQPIFGHAVHYHQIQNVKEYVDPILNTLNENPLKPIDRQRIRIDTGIEVAIAVKSVKEHDQLLAKLDKDFIGEEVDKQADKIVTMLQTVASDKQAPTLKNIVEAVVNRQNLHEHIPVERRQEVAAQLYETVVNKFITNEAQQHITHFIENPKITEFAKDIDALSQHTAEFLSIAPKEAREIVHYAIRDAILKKEDSTKTSIEAIATTSKEALKEIDSNKNQLEERLSLIKQEFAQLVQEKKDLENLKADYTTNKTIDDMKQLLQEEIGNINNQRTGLKNQLTKNENNFKKVLKNKNLTDEKKKELIAENQARVNEFAQNLEALSIQEKTLTTQMQELEQNNKTSGTPYDQRIMEIDVELSKVFDQLKTTYTSLDNYNLDVEIQNEAFKRVMALIHREVSESIDYSKSLQEIANETATKIAKQLSSNDTTLEESAKYKKTILTDYDSFSKFYTSVAPGSLAARAALKLFVSREGFTPEQKNRLAQVVAEKAGYEDNLVENGHAYLIAYMDNETNIDDNEVLPSIIHDAVLSDEAKEATTYKGETPEETKNEETHETTGFFGNIFSFFGSAPKV